ncbi:phosphate acyltransferase PlsX [Murinocardiopsis flavida]
MGGDNAPGEVVKGAVRAVREHGVRLVLVGRRAEITELLRAEGATDIPVVNADEVLAMHEGALASWRRPRSSVAVACKLIRNGDAAALVSAGTTGGVVATSTVRLRTQPGVLRPALTVALPTRPNPTILLDAGANADAKPEMLVQFAHLGAAYAHTAHGISEPRVGILTIGAEPGKGNRLARRTTEMLAAIAEGPPKLNFRGNIEGHDLLAGHVDVVVTDGFTGNVALKTVEGTVRFVLDEVRGALSSGPMAKAGAFLQRRSLRELGERVDSETYGGAVLLGLNNTVVIAHGSSRAQGVAGACVLAERLVEGRIADQVRRRVTAGGRATGWLHRLSQSEE